jgi:hypothetical protein
MADILDSKQAATILNVSPRRIRKLAQTYNIGRKIGRDWIFTRADIAKLKNARREPGRPPSPMSRSDTATITMSEWIPDHDEKKNLFWLTVKTDKTGNAYFRIHGVKGADLEHAQDWKFSRKFDIGSTITLHDLHSIPVTYDLLANLTSGINLHFGILNDGLARWCGKLAFARIVDNTQKDKGFEIPPNAIIHAMAAARLYAEQGEQAAKDYMENLGFRVYRFDIGGPSITDDCVFEVR